MGLLFFALYYNNYRQNYHLKKYIGVKSLKIRGKNKMNGSIKTMKVTCLLEESKEQLNEVVDGNIDISATGYNYLNKFTSLSILEPARLVVNGNEVENPYVVRDVNGGTQDVYYKCICCGYSPMGNIVATSSFIHFSPHDYLVKDLMEAVVTDEKAGKVTKEPFLTDNDMQNYVTPFKDDLVLVANLMNVEVLHALDEYSKNRQFAERIAQTICKRNALKQHPALTNVLTSIQGEPGFRKAKVTLQVPLVNGLSREQLVSVAEDLENVKIDDGIEFRELAPISSEEMLGLKDNSMSQNQPSGGTDTANSKQQLLDRLKFDVQPEIRKMVTKEKFPNLPSYSNLDVVQLRMLVETCEERMRKM